MVRLSSNPQSWLARALRLISGVASNFVILIIRIYRYTLSPLLPSACRFTPTCSIYMIEAIQVFGVFKGSLIGLKRISRCHPFSSGGYDPLPAHSEHRHWFR